MSTKWSTQFTNWFIFQTEEIELVLNKPASYFEKYGFKTYLHVDLDPAQLLTAKVNNETPTIELSNTIFYNKEKLLINLKRDYDIHFINCIFNDWIKIYSKHNKISFDNCVFLDHFSHSNFNNISELSFHNCAINKLYLSGFRLHEINLSNNHIPALILGDIDINRLHTYSNNITKLLYSDNHCINIKFNPHQLIASNPSIFGFKKMVNNAIYTHNTSIFKYVTIRTPLKSMSLLENIRRLSYTIDDIIQCLLTHLIETYNINTGRMEEAVLSKIESRIQTLEFLRTKTYYKHFPIAQILIEYVEKQILYEKRIIKPLLWSVGYFINPINILYITLLIIFMFGVVYYTHWALLCPTNNNISSTISLLDCLYFSATTFLTIGYGDYIPLDQLRAFAMAEGFLGVLMSGLFIVILSRFFISGR